MGWVTYWGLSQFRRTERLIVWADRVDPTASNLSSCSPDHVVEISVLVCSGPSVPAPVGGQPPQPLHSLKACSQSSPPTGLLRAVSLINFFTQIPSEGSSEPCLVGSEDG